MSSSGRKRVVKEERSETVEENWEILKQGAEAKIYKCRYLGMPAVIKERFKKNYRHPDLDDSITKDRIKNEARAMVRCKNVGVRSPCLYLVDFDRRRIYMEYFVQNVTLKEFLTTIIIKHEDATDVDIQDVITKLTKMIGITIRRLHEYGIIHGDLTTSNLLLVPIKLVNKEVKWIDIEPLEVAFIDFGLSFMSSSAEDKAVDLYVLERALISTHNDFPELFNQIIAGYTKMNKKAAEVLPKLEEVRARGRKRTMVG